MSQLALFAIDDSTQYVMSLCARDQHHLCPSRFPGCGWQGFGKPRKPVPDHVCSCPCHDTKPLPVHRRGELVNGFLPSYRCPACNRKVQGGGSTPVHVDELRTGWNVHNACCGYTWFEPDEDSHE